MKIARVGALIALTVAGAVHLLAAPDHVQHMTIHGVFLLGVGIAQLSWVLVALKWQTRAVALAGIALSGGILLLYFLLYSIPSPFPGHLALHARTPDWTVAVTKAAEAIACVLLVWLLIDTPRIARGTPHWLRAVMSAMIASVAIGLSLWFAASVVEAVFPSISSATGWPTAELIATLRPTDAPPLSEQDVVAEPGYEWRLPAGFPMPRIPADNPMTAEKVELGRYLFYDKRLSGNGTQSCESCHFQEYAFSDQKVVPTGATGEVLLRNSPALVNVAYNATLTWANPVLTEVERQVLIPIFGEFPVELGVTGHEKEVLARLRADSHYPRLFALAFPADADPITFHNITYALASFVRSLVSGGSAYDRYLAGDKSALSPEALHGMEIFFSESFECHHCHIGFNFSASTVHANSTFSASAFQNNGLYNLDGHGAYPRGNRGLFEITGEANDMGRFRPPTLRNVGLTAPYMHDGSIATLEDVVRHYAAGGRVTTEGPLAGDGRRNPIKSGLIPGFEISDAEVRDLVAFLNSLTDPGFVSNPRYANPFDDTPDGEVSAASP